MPLVPYRPPGYRPPPPLRYGWLEPRPGSAYKMFLGVVAAGLLAWGYIAAFTAPPCTLWRDAAGVGHAANCPMDPYAPDPAEDAPGR